MSNIFQQYARLNAGVVSFSVGSGALPAGSIRNQHLNVAADGSILASNGAITHYGAGLPFDANGRVVVGAGAPNRFDQAIPFTATNAVATGGARAYVGQGVAFAADGALATS